MVGATTNDQAMLYSLFGPRLSSVKLEAGQRERKNVRLGKRGRRLAFAASMGHAWDWIRAKRLDRGEIGG